MKPISEQINEVLQQMEYKSDILESYVIRKDGLIMTSSNPHVKNHMIAAMAASLINIGEKTLNDIGKDNLEKVLIKGEKLQIVIMGSSTVALVCAVESTANLGMVFLKMKRAVEKIFQIIQDAYID
ncbi:MULTISPECIES: roadblock/LC7 domain-containing protein [Methanobacterium]|jgi:predicted regulator of Ras-like GTPase activity (Roadblock/LC7/MglB family)|uniref:Roadblock/LC7 domain-containing protein n=1 Tax=Methanobacterium formicicum TaxID=2162 RepID=A0A089ZUR2_METFO|nr:MULTISPECIES: roadblock/LC7 domain-containing protein [Methanobacterium]AIS31129.1 roadblock/LC7 domain-containing protein [Methanobacterium formicicum]KUK71521.1 MAG: Roadblock/LC7 family protein [Methanobacterium sp. 42_16]MBF4475473.1 roadblock/LC7 domain-containing protein [Methanobacterium formicicum]MDD4810939.1 roadblock/LC7 domain-containing protein [Methanobacterium formicicum]MDG3548290.1 roadblock/LC7 domain-containing protein [Methanobacterium formicicum]